ncbi:histidine kinase [Brachybacterium sp. P6-10-X1]|nr:histidine kinase [Brachybacterium sp. P6-10-X1]
MAIALADLARELQQQDPEDTLEAMVRSAVEMIPGVEEGSISIVLGRKTVTAQVPTSELPSRVDAIQTEEGEGPCLSAVYEHTTVRIPDLETEQRWPAFVRRAMAETDVRGMLAFQLFVEDENLGALNLFSRRPHVFDDESEHVGLLVAAHAAVAFADSRRNAQLEEAIASRDAIGQAKGILMERYKITPQQAFFLLTEASNRTNTQLAKVADHLVTSGELRTGPNRG